VTELAGDSRSAEPPRGGRRQAIFLEDFIDVALRLEQVRERFAGDGNWLEPSATAAVEDGERLYMRIGPSWAAGRVSRAVRVSLGPTRERGESCVVPLAWEAAALPALFPVLDGDLELTPLGADSCRLTLFASYVPPLGGLGRGLDRAVLHRVAQSSVRSFLTRVAAKLEAGGGNGE
jgi:hypothetical protein